MKAILNQIYAQKPLSYQQAKQVLIEIGKGEHNSHQIAAFISSYSLRYITIEELVAFRDAMLELCFFVDLSAYKPIDLCGTGGDEKNTFNISTLSAILTATCGVKVAKHGNYGVSSICGSSNVLEALGIQFTNDEQKLKIYLEKAGICFLHAPLFHPAMKHIAPIRKELNVRTFFNILGPLVNPSPLYGQLAGVFSLEIMRLYHYVLQKKSQSFAITHSLDGYDEVSLTDKFKLITPNSEKLLDASYFLMDSLKEEDLFGGNTIDEATEIFLKIAKGEGTDAQNKVVIANTALALQSIQPNESINSLIFRAQNNLKEGRVFELLKDLLDIQTSLNSI